jgi:predicted transcriptional regulator
MAQKKKSSAAKWVVIMAVVGILIAIAVVAAAGLSRSRNKTPKELAKVALKAEILSFTYQTTPSIYSGLVKLNNRVLLIDKELERLKEIESEFPDQKKIINSEKLNWNKIQKTLLTSISKTEKTVETLYVMHLINQDKGKTLIDKEKKPLSQIVDKALTDTAPEIKRLKTTENKSFLHRIKEKLL